MKFNFKLLPILFLNSLIFSICQPHFFAAESPLYSGGQADSLLLQKIKDLVKNFKGDVGIYVRHLAKGNTAEIRSDEVFPTASMIKVPILISVFDKIESGKLKYLEEFVYNDSLLYPGEDILGSFKEGEKITLSKLVMLMITMSDNTASLWCQELAGTGTEINAWLNIHDFKNTRVNSKTKDRYTDWEKFGWGQTTPWEMAELLVMIREGRAVSKAASEEMYRLLSNIYWHGEALSQIPPYVQAASKQGAVDHSRSEAVLVNAPSGDYVFSIITKNQQDKAYLYENEGFVLIRDLSKLLWHYFEPGSDWQAAGNIQMWKK